MCIARTHFITFTLEFIKFLTWKRNILIGLLPASANILNFYFVFSLYFFSFRLTSILQTDRSIGHRTLARIKKYLLSAIAAAKENQNDWIKLVRFAEITWHFHIIFHAYTHTHIAIYILRVTHEWTSPFWSITNYKRISADCACDDRRRFARTRSFLMVLTATVRFASNPLPMLFNSNDGRIQNGEEQSSAAHVGAGRTVFN